MFEDLLRRLRYDVTTLSNQLLTVFASPIIYGRIVDVTIPNGGATVTTKHGLGRVAQGALFVSCSDAGNIYAVIPVTTADTITVDAYAPATSDVSIRLWVF